MLFQPKDTLSLLAILAPLSRAQYIQQSVPYAFPEDKINATITVHFDGYNITAPFSNSSEATVPWQARLDVRAAVDVEERLDGHVPSRDDSEEDPAYRAVTQIKIAYDVEDSEDLEDVDESWGYCAAMQPLFNVSVPADEQVDPTCQGLLDVQCIEALHKLVNSTDFCESARDTSVDGEIFNGVWCQGQYFPGPRTDMPSDVPEWSVRTNLTWDRMEWHYGGERFEDEDDTDYYDEMASRVFVLLASWGERNESRSGTINNGTLLDGTVLCLRANETTQGSRTLQEIAEDDASMVGGRDIFTVFIVAVSVAMIVSAF